MFRRFGLGAGVGLTCDGSSSGWRRAVIVHATQNRQRTIGEATDARNMDKGTDSGHARARCTSRITVPEIARRLNIGRLAVYAMLDQGILPGIRLGRRWIITRHVYEQFERTCGTRCGAGLSPQPEVKVLN